MFTRKTIPLMFGLLLLVAVAFIFLSRSINWTYVSELYKDEPTVNIEPTPQIQPPIKLEIAVSLNEQEYQELLEASEQVAEQYPYFELEITNYYDKKLSYSDWERLARLGKLGDIQLVPNEWVVPLAIQGLYQPVDRLISNEVLSDQMPSIVDALKWNGYLWALPYETDPYLIFIHKQGEALFETYMEEFRELEQQMDRTTDPDASNKEETLTADAMANDIMSKVSVLTNLSKTESSHISSNQPIESDSRNLITELSFNRWAELYEQITDFAGPLLNVETDDFGSLLTWLSLWSSSEQDYMMLTAFNEQQQQFLHYIDTHTEHIATSSPTLTKAEQQPLFYLTTASQYFEQNDIISEYYDLSGVIAPLPWLNGKSFMLSASTFGSEKNDAAMRWMEMLNGSHPNGTLSHRKFTALLSSNVVQAELGEKFQEKLINKQLFQVDRNWVEDYERMQQHWRTKELLQDKLTLWLRN